MRYFGHVGVTVMWTVGAGPPPPTGPPSQIFIPTCPGTEIV
jgi:hypothetical protein